MKLVVAQTQAHTHTHIYRGGAKESNNIVPIANHNFYKNDELIVSY